MDWLEEELKQALARKMPSADFAARVAAAGEERRGRGPSRWMVPRRWMAAAAAIVLMAGGGMEYREYRGHVAKERVLLALRITAGKLNRIQIRALRAPHEVRP